MSINKCRQNVKRESPFGIRVVVDISWSYQWRPGLVSEGLVRNRTLMAFRLSPPKYWVSQKVCSGFSVRCYRKPEGTFWPA